MGGAVPLVKPSFVVALAVLLGADSMMVADWKAAVTRKSYAVPAVSPVTEYVVAFALA